MRWLRHDRITVVDQSIGSNLKAQTVHITVVVCIWPFGHPEKPKISKITMYIFN